MKIGYGRRALVETTMGRYIAIIDPRLRARSLIGQRAEAAVGVAVLNRLLEAGSPDCIRCSHIAAQTIWAVGCTGPKLHPCNNARMERLATAVSWIPHTFCVTGDGDKWGGRATLLTRQLRRGS